MSRTWRYEPWIGIQTPGRAGHARIDSGGGDAHAERIRRGGESAAGGLLPARSQEAEQQRRQLLVVAEHRLGQPGVTVELARQLGQMLAASVVLEHERKRQAAFGPDADPVRLRERCKRRQADRVLVEELGGVAPRQPGPQFPGALAGVGGKCDEEPVGPDHVGETLRALQRGLPSGAHLRYPFPVIAVLSAQEHGAERAEQVVPRRRPGRLVRPEAVQRAEPCERIKPVARGDDVVERERSELVGGQYSVLGHSAD